MYERIDFNMIPFLTEEFEAKTQPRFGSTDTQFDNILSLLGLEEKDVDILLEIANGYIDEEEMEFFHSLRGIFVVGFCLAMYASMDRNSNPLSVH